MKTPAWVVKKAIPRDDHTIVLVFADGQKKLYDARSILEKEMYRPLRSIPFFLTGRVEYDTVVWSEEIDIAPESLYEDSTAME